MVRFTLVAKKRLVVSFKISKSYQDAIIFNKIKKLYNKILDKNSEFI